MPNWCYTNITFYSTNESSVKAMHNQFKEIYEGDATMGNDFGHGWMGDYANIFFPETGADKIDCRGIVDRIGDIEKLDNYCYFKISTETAWSAKLGMWQKIVDLNYPDVKIAYIAEESNFEYYLKWDDDGLFYNDEYYVDGYVPSKENEGTYLDGCYDGTIRDIQKRLDDILPFEYLHSDDCREMENSIREKLDEYREQFDNNEDFDDDFFIIIGEFVTCDPREFDFIK